MSGQLLEIIAKRALRDTARKNINSKDPYFEEVAIYDRHGRATGKVKKQKKGIPGGLSANDGKVLRRVRKQAYRLDMSLFNCCGIRFGWSSVIGIIPVVGDVVDLFLAWLVVKSCGHIDGGLPAALQYRMYFNVLLDFGLGLVPFLGDVADAVFRANTRNAWILEEYLIKKSEEEARIQADKHGGGPVASQAKLDAVAPGAGAGAHGTPSFGPGIGPIARSDGDQPSKKSLWSMGGSSHQTAQVDQEMGALSKDTRPAPPAKK